MRSLERSNVGVSNSSRFRVSPTIKRIAWLKSTCPRVSSARMLRPPFANSSKMTALLAIISSESSRTAADISACTASRLTKVSYPWRSKTSWRIGSPTASGRGSRRPRAAPSDAANASTSACKRNGPVPSSEERNRFIRSCLSLANLILRSIMFYLSNDGVFKFVGALNDQAVRVAIDLNAFRWDVILGRAVFEQIALTYTPRKCGCHFARPLGGCDHHYNLISKRSDLLGDLSSIGRSEASEWRVHDNRVGAHFRAGQLFFALGEVTRNIDHGTNEGKAEYLVFAL